jgi:protease-4
MKNFFKKVGKFLDVTRKVTVNIFTAIFVIYFIVIIAMLFSGDEEVVTAGKVVILNPDGIFVEEERVDYSFESIFEETTSQYAYRDFERLIDALVADEEVPAILLDFSSAGYSGPSTLLRVAEQVARLSDAGKEVIAYSDRYSTANLLVASSADQILAHQAGAVNLNGLGGDAPYVNELLGKIGVTVHDYSQGQFKSANETITRNDMSENDRMQRLELLEPIWEEMLARIGSNRGIEVAELQNFSDTFFSFIPEAAFANIEQAIVMGLIDEVISYPDFRARMVEAYGADEESEIGSYNHIFFGEYMTTLEEEPSLATDEIVVIYAEGAIMEGESASGVIGADSEVLKIRRAHNNENTRAIVYRVNSPGGSIIASEMIRDELFAAKNKGIPVVVSMSDYAASGGVYISTPADYIFAEPYTITGSIGVAIAIPTVDQFFEKIGVNFDGVNTSALSWDLNQPMTDEIDALFAEWGARSYDRFIAVVSSSREEDPEYIKSIAGGRVWLGNRALELNLIDELGGIDEAIAKAVEIAELEDYRINYLEPELSFEEIIIREILGVKLNGLATRFMPNNILRAFAENQQLLNALEPSASYSCINCLVNF